MVGSKAAPLKREEGESFSWWLRQRCFVLEGRSLCPHGKNSETRQEIKKEKRGFIYISDSWLSRGERAVLGE